MSKTIHRRDAENLARAYRRGDLTPVFVQERVLFVVHVERGERDRIISARQATAPERDVYDGGGS